jgi:hypothetical protein
MEARWIDYVAPETPLAAAIQYPMDGRWPNRVINGYVKTAEIERQKRKATKDTTHADR